MDALKRRLALAAFAVVLLAKGPDPTAARAGEIARWHGPVAEASQRFGMPQAWIIAVIRAESGGRTHWNGRPITSHRGAMGLMQLMPGTWAETRAALGLGHDPHDPRDNILAGTFYLRRMYDRFGYPGLFAAYNAGPGRYAAYLAGRSRLPRETRIYLARVSGEAAAAAMASTAGQGVATARSGGIFFQLGAPVARGLFVVRNPSATSPELPEPR